MPHSTYLILHLTGLLFLALAIGGLVISKTSDNAKTLKILHGVGLFLLLLGGFGMLARLSIGWPFPVWIFVKLFTWFVLGAFPAYQGKLKGNSDLIFAIILILTSIVMGVIKPF